MVASSTLNQAVPGPDDLHSGNIRTQPITVAAGTYARGEVLGRSALGAALTKVPAPGATAIAIMPIAITLAAPTAVPVYIAGDFNQDALVYDSGGGVLLATIKDALRDVGIMVRKWGAASGS
jgi:hypothetical protein